MCARGLVAIASPICGKYRNSDAHRPRVKVCENFDGLSSPQRSSPLRRSPAMDLADDDGLHVLADRIQARAGRRMGRTVETIRCDGPAINSEPYIRATTVSSAKRDGFWAALSAGTIKKARTGRRRWWRACRQTASFRELAPGWRVDRRTAMSTARLQAIELRQTPPALLH